MNLSSQIDDNRQTKPSFLTQQQQQQQTSNKKKLDLSSSEVIVKQGNWSNQDRKKIIKTIHEAHSIYATDLQKQVSFLHFHLQQHLGKRIQVVIFDKTSTKGHCLYAMNDKFIQLTYQQYGYVVWKVTLIQDNPLDREY